jgi:signal transduction protein with GAF and PtsI domain
MEKHFMHYETFLKVTRVISESKDPEEVVLMTAESVKTALGVKGCSIFLLNRKTDELELAASFGLSKTYLEKGPVNYMHSIQESLGEEPVAIYDVMDDPRIQYPEEAAKEGIASILAVPIVVHGKVIGALRVYTAEPWDFTLEDVNLIQAVSQICGMAIDAARLRRGYKTSIEILKNMRNPEEVKSNRWTPYEGIPKSVEQSICDY